MKIKNCLYGGGVLALEFFLGIIWKLLRQSDTLSSIVSKYDMLYYIFSIVSTVILTILVSNFCKIKIMQNASENGKRELVFEIFTYFIIAYSHIRIFLNTMLVPDAGSFYMPWHSNRFLELIVIFLFGICILGCRLLLESGNVGFQKISLVPWYLFLAVISIYSLYQPNCFSSFYNMYHSHAYFNSVYRVLHFQPYSEVNTGVYGFYGIILAPFMRLFGTDFKACVISLLILTFVSILCYFYVLENLTDCVIVKLLASICIISPLIALSSNIYLQLWPHRIIFIGYILAFIVWKNKQRKCNRWHIFIGYILMICSVIWNFETGLGCVFAYFGSEIIYTLQLSKLKDFHTWKKVFFYVLQIPILITSSWILCCGYNLAVSSDVLSIKTFLFPFIGNTYIGDLDIPLSSFPSAWMLVLTLILVSIEAVVLSTNLCGNGHRNQKLIYLTACVIGVSVQMMYFINRSVYGNLYIVLPVVSLIMTFWIDFCKNIISRTPNAFGNGCIKALGSVLISAMILVCLMSICRFYPLEMAKESGRSEEDIQNIKGMISEQVPEDTQGIGVGVPEIYSFLGWDTGFYGIDMADFDLLSNENKNYIYEMINNSNDIFVNKTNLVELNSDGVIEDFFRTHDLIADFSYGDMEFGYYRKKIE